MAESFVAETLREESKEGEETGVELYSWGWNEHGNLGLGDITDR